MKNTTIAIFAIISFIYSNHINADTLRLSVVENEEGEHSLVVNKTYAIDEHSSESYVVVSTIRQDGIVLLRHQLPVGVDRSFIRKGEPDSQCSSMYDDSIAIATISIYCQLNDIDPLSSYSTKLQIADNDTGEILSFSYGKVQINQNEVSEDILIVTGDISSVINELPNSNSSLFLNGVDFNSGFVVPDDIEELSGDAQAIYTETFSLSETFSMQILLQELNASLLKTESEILYTDPNGVKTDFLVNIVDFKVGVTVSRAFMFPFDDPFSFDTAVTLLSDQLENIIESSENVLPEDAWQKQILYIFTSTSDNANTLQAAYESISGLLTTDTILIITVTDGDDEFLYQ